MTASPIKSTTIQPCATAAAAMALPIASSTMPAAIALRSPIRAAVAEADRATASSAPRSGRSEAPASMEVKPGPSLPCA
jgi:hypothetical protein